MQPIEKLAKKRKYTGKEAGQLYVYQNMQSILNARGEDAANYVTQEKFNKIMESFPSEYEYKFMSMYAAAYKAILKIYNNRPHEAAAFHTGMELLINALREIKTSARLMKAIKEYRDASKPAPADDIEGMNLIYRLQDEIKHPSNPKIRRLLLRARDIKATADKSALYYIFIEEIGFFKCSDGKNRDKLFISIDYKEIIEQAYFLGAEFVEACLSKRIDNYVPSKYKAYVDIALKELMQNPERAIKNTPINLDIAYALNLLGYRDGGGMRSGEWRPIAWEYQPSKYIEEINVSEYDVIRTLAYGIPEIQSDITKSGAIENFQSNFPELFAALLSDENGGILNRAQNKIKNMIFDEIDEPDENEAAVSSLTGTIEAIALTSLSLENGHELKHYTEKNTMYLISYWTAFNAVCLMIEKIFDIADFSRVFAVSNEAIKEKTSEYNALLYEVYGIIGGLYGDYIETEMNRETIKRRIKESFIPLPDKADMLLAISETTRKKTRAIIMRRYRMRDISFFENINTTIQEVMKLEEAQNEADRKKRRNP